MISAPKRNARSPPCGRPKPLFAGTRLGQRHGARFGIETHQNDGGYERNKHSVSTENWAEERTRLVRLLAAIESGTVTHVDEENLRQLQATNPGNISALKERLAELNSRLGETGDE
jgi:hypothetical protein